MKLKTGTMKLEQLSSRLIMIKRLFRRIVNLFRPMKFKAYTHEEERIAEFVIFLTQNFLFDDGLGKFTAEECLKAYLRKCMKWERLSEIMREKRKE